MTSTMPLLEGRHPGGLRWVYVDSTEVILAHKKAMYISSRAPSVPGLPGYGGLTLRFASGLLPE